MYAPCVSGAVNMQGFVLKFCMGSIYIFICSVRLLPRETGGPFEGMITPQRRHCALDLTIQRCLFLWLFVGYGELEKKRERQR